MKIMRRDLNYRRVEEDRRGRRGGAKKAQAREADSQSFREGVPFKSSG